MPINRAKVADRLLWFVVGLNICVGIAYLVVELLAIKQNLLLGSDFSVFYAEGLMVREGHATQIYDVDLEKIYQSRVLEGKSFLGGILPFVYPPYVALLFVPFALFPHSIAVVLWMACQGAVLAFLLVRLVKLTPTWSQREHWLMGSAIVAFLPLLFTFTNGAFSLIVLACLIQIYGSLKNRRDGQAGAWFTAGLIKPQFFILPGVTLLSARRWRSLIVAVLGGLGLVIISSLALGWRIWPDYLRLAGTMTGYFGSFGFTPEVMYNFRGILTLVLGNQRGALVNMISLAALAASALAVFWIWRGPYRPEEPDFSLRMGLTLLLGVFFNLHVYHQDGLQIVGPVLLFYDYLQRRGLPRRAYAIAALSFPYIFLAVWLIINTSWFSLVPGLFMCGLLIWMGKALYDERQFARSR